MPMAARLTILTLITVLSLRAPAAEPAPAPSAPLTIHVISGSKEYRSEESLKPFLADLEKRYKVTVTASWGQDGGGTLDNLAPPAKADVLPLSARRLKLPEEQM